MNDTPSTAISMPSMSITHPELEGQLIHLVNLVLTVGTLAKARTTEGQPADVGSAMMRCIDHAKNITAYYKHVEDFDPTPVQQDAFFRRIAHNFKRYINILEKCTSKKLHFETLRRARIDIQHLEEYESLLKKQAETSNYPSRDDKDAPLPEIHPYIDYEIELLKLLKSIAQYRDDHRTYMSNYNRGHKNIASPSLTPLYHLADQIQRTITNIEESNKVK